MTRLFLAAGVAALAIAAPTAAKPGGGNGNGGGAAAAHGGGHGGGGQKADRGGGGGQKAERGGGGQKAERGGGGQKAERGGGQQAKAQRAERQQVRQQARVERQQPQRIERQQLRAQRKQADRAQQAQAKRFERQQVRADRVQQVRNNRELKRIQQAENSQKRIDRIEQRQLRRIDNRDLRAAQNGQGYGVGGCPPGLADKGCMPPGQAKNLGLAPVITTANADFLRRANEDAFRASTLSMLAAGTPILAPNLAANYLGMPLSALAGQVPLMALPQSANYLYPATDDYYYRYGNGYLYQVDRGSNLIEALLPLLAGGLLPGTQLPSTYMNSYVPNSFGLNSFYPANYSNYGGYDNYYGNTCNRYADGVVYQVDCGTGLIRNVVPTYAGGYGVGQMLPSAYSYYNLPTQYRSMYQPTNDHSYWYAPGAIYQVDPSSSLITSVAALLSPGFNIGQPLPAGYGMYNVPLAYRDQYYDTNDAWYRYNNGNIYQVDPTTQLVTAIVASLLT